VGGMRRAPVDCGTPMRPPDVRDLGYGLVDVPEQTAFYEAYNDVLAAAFICDACRIAVINVGRPFAPGSNDETWHTVAHEGADPSGAQQNDMTLSQNNVFRVVTDLANKLDVPEDDASTYLDNSLVQWTQEAGLLTHIQIEMPVIQFGGAGGTLRTGEILDYRNLTFDEIPLPPSWGRPERNEAGMIQTHVGTYYTGLTYNQWLSTALQAMGLRTDEFTLPGNVGYGPDVTDNPDAWLPHMRSMAYEILPQLGV
jgi:hypothetical protein